MNQIAVDTLTSADGTTIAFERTGSGPAVVLVDAASCFRGFGPMMRLPELLAADFTVIRYDRRGRGESTDTPPYAVDREVDDLQALIDAAGGSAYVFGFSSGAVLALHAALRGLAIRKLVLLEPPLELDGPPSTEPDLAAELSELIDAGRRGDAVVHFNTSIGVPPEIIAGLRQSEAWPALERLAHTLVYDCVVTRIVPADRLAALATPTLVVNSAGSDHRLRGWARQLCDVMPNATHREMDGEWHGVPLEDLAPVLTAFFAAEPAE
jgi:pimeloyl-ACP methyl ester carboxylesterase